MSTQANSDRQASRQMGEDELALLGEFIAEAIEHIDSIEAVALKLEASPGDDRSINTIFRGFHTIKGGAGFVGLRQIGELAHAAEDVLEHARHRRLELIGPTMDLVLQTADGIRSLVGSLDVVRSTGQLPADDPTADELVARLKRCARLEPADSPSAIEPMPATPANTEFSPPDVAESPPDGVDSIVRIKTQRLDALMNLIGELVVAELMVREAQEGSAGNSLAAQQLAHLHRITRELYDLSVSLRMVPIRATFQKMARAARDIGRKMGKEIELKISGEDTELDRKLIEAIGDPLMHMVRNAIDHGIEPPEDRLRLRKARAGLIAFEARHEGGEILIEIRDDGGGLDRHRILTEARRAGLIEGGEELTDRDVWAFVFHPGLSTAENLTEVSGRGVGMDVVKRNVEALRGSIEIQSSQGAGTLFRVRLPLTLAVIDTLAVGVGAERYLLPITSIEESIQPTPDQLRHAPGVGEMCLVRGKPLPLVRLGELFGVDGQKPGHGGAIAVVVRDGQRRCCLLVDALLGQQQVVLKPMGPLVGDPLGICGGTVLGDGRIALVLDVPGLVRRAAGRQQKLQARSHDRLSGVHA